MTASTVVSIRWVTPEAYAATASPVRFAAGRMPAFGEERCSALRRGYRRGRRSAAPRPGALPVAGCLALRAPQQRLEPASRPLVPGARVRLGRIGPEAGRLRSLAIATRARRRDRGSRGTERGAPRRESSAPSADDDGLRWSPGGIAHRSRPSPAERVSPQSPRWPPLRTSKLVKLPLAGPHWAATRSTSAPAGRSRAWQAAPPARGEAPPRHSGRTRRGRWRPSRSVRGPWPASRRSSGTRRPGRGRRPSRPGAPWLMPRVEGAATPARGRRARARGRRCRRRGPTRSRAGRGTRRRSSGSQPRGQGARVVERRQVADATDRGRAGTAPDRARRRSRAAMSASAARRRSAAGVRAGPTCSSPSSPSSAGSGAGSGARRRAPRVGFAPSAGPATASRVCPAPEPVTARPVTAAIPAACATSARTVARRSPGRASARSSSARPIASRSRRASGVADPREGEPGSTARDARGPGGDRRLGGACPREDRLDVADADRPEPDPGAARPDRRQQGLLGVGAQDDRRRRPAAPRAS